MGFPSQWVTMIFENISELPGLDRALIQNMNIARFLRVELNRSDYTIPGHGQLAEISTSHPYLAESREQRRTIF